MKPPAASPGRAEKQLPAPPGLARLLLSKSRRGARSRRAPATSPMFLSRGRSAGRAAAAVDGEPSSPKVTCIGQVRMRKGKGKKGKMGAGAAVPPKASPPERAKGYCRCLKKVFLCGGLFDFDGRRRPKAPSPEVERSRRSPWVFSSRDVAVAAAPKLPDPRRDHGEEEDDEMEVGVGAFGSVERDDAEELGINGGDDKEDEEGEGELVSSATTTPPKNALLLMRCRSAPQNRSSPLTSRFPVTVPSPTKDAGTVEIAAVARASPSPRKAGKVAVEREHEKRQEVVAVQDQEEVGKDKEEDEEEEEEMRCSSARPLVLPRCKSEPAATAAAKMAAGTEAEATTAGCFWANGGSSGRRRHAPPPPPAAAAVPVVLTGH